MGIKYMSRYIHIYGLYIQPVCIYVSFTTCLDVQNLVDPDEKYTEKQAHCVSKYTNWVVCMLTKNICVL